MDELELVAPQRTVTVTFSLEPVYNFVSILLLLEEAERTSGFSEWAEQTAARMSPERRYTHQLLLEGLSTWGYLEGVSWPSVPVWLDDLSARDPFAMRDRVVEGLSAKARGVLGDGSSSLPTPAQLLADRTAYLSIVEQLICYKGKKKTFDTSLYEKVHVLLNDPPGMKELLVAHLRAMWDEVVSPEWERNLPMLQESIAAFESLDYGGKSTAEIISWVVGREAPAKWQEWQAEVDHLIFIPSAHIGPYLMLIEHDDKRGRIIFGARIPEGTAIRSPALSRSELLMRLSALVDDTRLRIVELLAREGELGAREIMAHLGLSQSSASRHLRQLSATGYLIERRHEGAKCYRLNRDRIDDTLDALKGFL